MSAYTARKTTTISIDSGVLAEIQGLIPAFNLSDFTREAMKAEVRRRRGILDERDKRLDLCKTSARW